MTGWTRLLVLGTSGLLACAALQAPRDPLSTVQPGQWQLHEIGSRTPGTARCVVDPKTLLQIRHQGAVCSRIQLSAGPNRASVRYSCPGAGYGQTIITVESPRLLRIQTQGIAEGQPFQLDYEARRTGLCSPRAAPQTKADAR